MGRPRELGVPGSRRCRGCDPGDEPGCGRGTGTRRRSPVRQDTAGEVRQRRGSAPCRRHAPERSRSRRSRRRQRRPDGHRREHDRRPARAAPLDRPDRSLARGGDVAAHAGHHRHRDPSRRKPPRSRGAVRQQLPVLRGLPTSLRPRPCHRSEGADRPLPLRRRARAAERPCRPGRRRAATRPGGAAAAGSGVGRDRELLAPEPSRALDRGGLGHHGTGGPHSRECRPARRRARSVPPLGCDVGCLGRVRPDSGRLLRHCEGAGR